MIFPSNRVRRIWATIALAMAKAGCNDTSFKSQSPKKSADQVPVQPKARASSNETLKLTCKNGVGEARLVTDLKGGDRTKVKFEGQFCGIEETAATGKLAVAFVLDFSGSMDDNDPLLAGKCGRLAAAQAIVGKLQSDLSSKAEISVALVPFGRSALPTSGLEPLASFASRLMADSVCSSDGGDTNYEAAFTAARELLANVQGNKVVYFISDGLPTQMGTGIFTGLGGQADKKAVYDAGRRAAESLRAVPELTLNAVYLGNAGGDVALVAPETYLAEITGDKDRVRIATNAGDLASEILKFETPEAVTLDATMAHGTLTASSLGQSKNGIKIASLTPNPALKGVWDFVTESFSLFSDARTTTENELEFTAEAPNGKQYRASAVVRYTLESN